VTYLLVALLVVLVAPLLTSSWRISLAGLGLQGLLMTAILAQRGGPATAGGAVLLLDLLVLRTWLVPRTLAAVMRRQAPARTEVMPANLLTWTLAGAALLLAFRLAGLVEPAGGAPAIHLAVAAAGLLLGFLVLGAQASTFGQIVGVLRIEYAVALLELASPHELALPVQLGVTATLLLTALTLATFLARLGPAAPGEPGPGGFR
jgi:hydrogenase-4 membrane subunit HyfE